jgi:imidazolonepropionase-like amidohydrolase
LGEIDLADHGMNLPAMEMPPSAKVELRNGHVVDVVEGRVLDPSVRVMIEGERIIALPGLAGEPEIQADLAIDLGGRWVIPGLFNTHVHVTIPMPGPILGLREARLPMKYGRAQIAANLTDCLERGITTLRDGLCEDLRLLRRLKDWLACGELRGPRILQGVMVNQVGGTFSVERSSVSRVAHRAVGLSALRFDDEASGILTFPLDASVEVVRAAVDRAIDERGAEHIKVYDQREKQLTYEPGATVMTQEQLDALADQARRRGLRTVVHQVSVDSFRRAVRAGIDTLAHLPLDGVITSEDARAFAAAGCSIEPTATLGYFYGFEEDLAEPPERSRLERLAHLRRPDLWPRFLNLWVPPLRPLVRRSIERLVQGRRKAFGVVDVAPVFRYYARILAAGFDNLALLRREVGLTSIACGNDAGPSPSTPAGVDLELDMLDLGFGGPGLTSIEALRVATINSASALGLEAHLGSIAPGKIADLAIIDGDILADRHLIGAPVDALFMKGALVVNHCGLEAIAPPYSDHRPGAISHHFNRWPL